MWKEYKETHFCTFIARAKKMLKALDQYRSNASKEHWSSQHLQKQPTTISKTALLSLFTETNLAEIQTASLYAGASLFTSFLLMLRSNSYLTQIQTKLSVVWDPAILSLSTGLSWQKESNFRAVKELRTQWWKGLHIQ